MAAEVNGTALLIVTNAAFKEDDKFYGSPRDFTNIISSSFSQFISERTGLKIVGLRSRDEMPPDGREEDEEDQHNKVDESGIIETGKSMGCDYIIFAVIKEAKVKTSKKRLSLTEFNKKNFLIWSATHIRIMESGSGGEALSRIYTAEHSVSMTRDMFAQHMEITGIKSFEPKLQGIENDPEAFLASDLGIPYKQILSEFARDFEKLPAIKRDADKSDN